MNGNDQVTTFIKNITWNDLPNDVQAKAKQTIIAQVERSSL